MSCLAPISVPDTLLRARGVRDASLIVPCGHCVECARARRNDWFVRLWSVYKRYEALDLPVWFVTITIDPSLWPNHNKKYDGVDRLVTPFIRSWNERLRYLNDGKMPLRFLCSEFGSSDRDYVDCHGNVRVTTGALHFHGLLFGYLDIKRLQDGFCKTHGYVHFDRIRGPQGIRYVVKYCTKDYSIENPLLRARTFCSPGIGDPTFYFGNTPATDFVIINGFHYHTPRYFKERQWLNIYAFNHQCSIGVARKAFYDSFGHNSIVINNAVKRYSIYLDQIKRAEFLRYDNPLCDSSYREYRYSSLIDSRSLPLLSDVQSLCSLGKVGPGHPALVYDRKFRLELVSRLLLSSDQSFVNVKPYFYQHERDQIVIPLSLDFSS